MAAQRYSRYSLTPSMAHHAIEYELDDYGELASSRPISLIQLYAKTGSRGRGSRGSKHSLSDITREAKEIGDDTGFCEANQHESSSRLSTLNRSGSRGNTLSDNKNYLALQSRVHLQEQRLKSNEEKEGLNRKSVYSSPEGDQIQKNPLNHASYYSPNHLREISGFLESPFLKSAEYSGPAHSTWSADIARSSNITPINTLQAAYNQKFSGKDDSEPTSSLQIYTANYDRPCNKSPYEIFKAKYRNHRTDIPEITSGLRYSTYPEPEYEPYAAYASIRSEPTFPTPVRGCMPDFDSTTYPTEPRSRIPNSIAQPVPHTHTTPTVGTYIPQLDADGIQARKRNLKEEICAILNNMNRDPKIDTKQTTPSRSKSTEDQSPPAILSLQRSEYKRDREPVLPESSTSQTTTAKWNELALESTTSGREKSKNLNEDPPRKPFSLTTVLSKYPARVKDKEEFETNLRHKGTAAGKSLKPPPGLPKPQYERTTDSPQLERAQVIEKGKLEETESWFHQGRRGEEYLRQHIANIAENIVEKNGCLSGDELSTQESIFAKQTILLLGNVIANLHSYVSGDRKEQAANFANFRAVGAPYCELDLDGRYSYFDRDPWVRSRSSSVGHTNSRPGNDLSDVSLLTKQRGS